MPKQVLELPFGELRGYVDETSLPFDHTGLLEMPEEKILGQERASDAIKFGMGMKSSGYHIFIAGPSKAGLTYAARTYIEEQAKKEPTPPDWCYVHNFKEPDKPTSIRLSAGRGRELKKDMQELIEAVQKRISEVFESDEYGAKEAEVHKAFERNRREVIEELSRLAKDEGFLLQVSQVGMMIIPATKEGITMSQEKLGTIYSITGTVAMAMKSTTLWVVLPADDIAAPGLVLSPGDIELDCAASNTGKVKWTLVYSKVDAAAEVNAV